MRKFIVMVILFVRTDGKKSLVERQVDELGQARADLTKVNGQQVQRAVLTFLSASGRLPENLRELQPQGLLLAGAADGWGRQFRYEKTGDSSFKLVSAGKDGAFGTADDIVLEY